MNRRTLLMMVTLMAVITMLGSAPKVMAGGEPGSGGERIIGPTMWGVGVIDGSGSAPYNATFRVKIIEDCVVKTKPLNQENMIDLIITEPNLPPIENLPDEADDILGVRIESGVIFDLPCVGVITKVKNFEQNGDLISFDAQVQFIANSDETECGK